MTDIVFVRPSSLALLFRMEQQTEEPLASDALAEKPDGGFFSFRNSEIQTRNSTMFRYKSTSNKLNYTFVNFSIVCN